MRKTVTKVCLLALLAFSLPFQPAQAAGPGPNPKPVVIPSLQEWKGDTGSFTMGDHSRIVIPPTSSLQRTAAVFQEDLKEITGRDVSIVQSNSPASGDFFLSLNEQSDDAIGTEGYNFEVGDMVKIRANTTTGVFYGTRSALQILQQDTAKASIVKGVAKDYPKYKERGFMLDVGRKFFTMDFLKDYVKFMSWYKMNDFQIHLNDNEIFKDNSRAHWDKYTAFRLESTKYPELTAKDGHYTKQEFRELQDIAKDRGMTITPELDTPSHALSFTKVRPDLVKDSLPVDHLDITRPEAVEFVKDVWSEYLDGNWFDAKEIHFGGDEFDRNDKTTVEAYRQYLNTMNDLFKSKGKTARMWGSLTFFPGTTPVDSDITLNGWNNGWQNPIDAINEGRKIINTTDGLLYIVPKAGYYYDYLNTKWLYENWEPTYFSGTQKVSADNPSLLGGMFAVWNDMLGKKVSAMDVHDRVKDALPTMAEKMWRGQSNDATYDQFRQASGAIGDAPNTNLLHTVKTQTETVLSYPFDEGGGQTAGDLSGNGYNGTLNGVQWTNGKTGKAALFSHPSDWITTGLTTKGFPWTVSAWVNMTAGTQPEAILLESADGAIKLKQKETGKAGFSREGFDFSFNTAIPTGRWVHVALKGDLSGTSLFVDGELKDKLTETTLLPAAVIGSTAQAFQGALDDLKIVDRALTGKEIAVAAGSPPWTINIAARQPAVASSEEVNYLTANLAFDEDESKNSRWASKYTDNEWIYVDLGKNYDINKVILKWEAAYAKGYKIQVSSDAQTWKDAYTTNAGVGGTEVIKFPTENARYVRMLGTKRAGTYGYSLYEFEVYQPNPNDDPVTVPVPIRYEQTFENNQLGGWQHVIGAGTGSMSVVSDSSQASRYALQLTANNTSNVFIDQNSPDIKDGEIEYKVTPTNTGNIRSGVVFRYTNKDSWASVGYDNGSWYWVNAQDSYGLLTNNTAAKLSKGVTSTVKIKFEGPLVTLFVNGTQYYEGSLASIPNVEGKMGARVFGPTVAEYDNFKYRNNVPDSAVPVTGVQLDKTAVALKEGETAELIATVQPNNATNKNVTWSSSNETVAIVATIGGKIVVTALKAGIAKIKATTTDGAFTAESTVTVEALSGPGVRVLTYNIHHGAGNDNIVNLPRIADVIKSLNPDLVALQEVDKNVPRSGNVDQAAKLAELTGMHVTFGKAIDLSGGEYGLALLSRYPITSSEKTLLPNTSGGEQRAVLTAKIAPTNGLPEFTFSGTHLEWNPKSIQADQVNKIVELYGSTSPYILAGDLNATPESDTIKSLTSKWTDATAGITDWTNEEDGKIDYIMYGQKNQWRVVNAQAIHDDVASDHRPVLSVLEWLGSQPSASGTTLSGTNSVPAGSEFTVRFGLRNVTQNVFAQDIKLNYNADVMEFVSAKSAKDGISIVESKDRAGALRLIIASQGAGHAFTGTAEFIDIVFKAKN
ncbi:family 20 glycosylhydrolase, partial [Paenibacillus planticolens]